MGFWKYIGVFIFAFTGWVAFTTTGWTTYLPVLFSFVLIPVIELFLPEQKGQSEVKNKRAYDFLLYAVVPIQYGLLGLFLFSMADDLTLFSKTGRILSMGILCGVYGINVAHEFGHRKSKAEQTLALALLLTSLYQHFFIEHNRGHHKRVGTPNDPATARKGENVYQFWARVIPHSLLSAWELEKTRLIRNSQPVWSWRNQMVRFGVTQIFFVLLIGWIFGLQIMGYFVIAAAIGIILLETINYIEHYGLMRNKISDVAYERVQPIHSWNSDHVIGRYLLFELTRHSDHHSNTSKAYPTLQSRKDASQLPTGYPGMMLLSLLPPLWFKVMNPRLPDS
jgi:alkane 1-monooxygenase